MFDNVVYFRRFNLWERESKRLIVSSLGDLCSYFVLTDMELSINFTVTLICEAEML